MHCYEGPDFYMPALDVLRDKSVIARNAEFFYGVGPFYLRIILGIAYVK